MDIIEAIKDWHIRICIAILLISSIIMLVLGLRFEDSVQTLPWWSVLFPGWSGLAVGLKLSGIWYKDKN